ncbi:hypothetical protein DFR55_1087 [Herbinix hemicellulosilytica]|uniref:Uncharacterized protein n=1 Tax=Herbinix hemicellulosilytica TaxID=1564487 RepID=A0A0H5SEZ4_HERHM|nr:hypothetical protein [Herbinix hemicellulosilytica]RBP58947.1 hypothetical protein DFR55_1087 [Herbinix hemicellulosilytica]CRZ34027.1 hypothetical protein HHT355_0824 [Herbinix hemicellulosilytica]
MKYKLKKELKTVFDAPAPARKEEFINLLEYPKANRLDFFISQIGYIRKRVWILSLLLFIGTLIGLYFSGASYSFVWVVSSVLPFVSLVTISEIARSITYNMDELEMSCKYNLLEVSLIRIGILGVVNLAVFIGILLLLSGKTDLGFIRLGIYLSTPYLLNCYGSLFVINRSKSRDTVYICGSVTALVSILNSLISIRIYDIYLERNRMFWAIAFIMFAVLSLKEIVKFIKRMEDLKWNSSLTA